MHINIPKRKKKLKYTPGNIIKTQKVVEKYGEKVKVNDTLEYFLKE